jgi:hypothetical protein
MLGCATVKVLPDFSQEYVIKWRAGAGSVNTQFELTDGWNLTGFNSTADSQLDEAITNVLSSNPANRLEPAGFKGAGLYRLKVDGDGNISLGELVLPLE